jgi:hypothetical protein
MDHSDGGADRVGDGARNDAPPGALTWKSGKQRNELLWRWQAAMITVFGQQARCLRVAWLLEKLFNVKKGYCWASDTTLARYTGLQVNKLQSTLTLLDRERAIIRAHVAMADGRTQRRIYPSAALIPPNLDPTWGVGIPPSARGDRI